MPVEWYDSGCGTFANCVWGQNGTVRSWGYPRHSREPSLHSDGSAPYLLRRRVTYIFNVPSFGAASAAPIHFSHVLRLSAPDVRRSPLFRYPSANKPLFLFLTNSTDMIQWMNYWGMITPAPSTMAHRQVVPLTSSGSLHPGWSSFCDLRLTSSFSYGCALFCSTEPCQLFSFQSIAHSFLCAEGVRTPSVVRQRSSGYISALGARIQLGVKWSHIPAPSAPGAFIRDVEAWLLRVKSPHLPANQLPS